MSEDIVLPPYAQEFFVNRQSEIRLVLAKVDALRQGYAVEKRTVIFTGEHGTGKTWLLAHLCQLLNAGKSIRSLSINLAPEVADIFSFSFTITPDLLDSPAEKITQIILKCLCTELFGLDVPEDKPLSETTRTLTHGVRQLLAEQPLVLLINSVYESAGELLFYLEDNVLAPLIVEPRVMIVMTGRGPDYPWNNPELRRAGAEFHVLRPFESAELTVEQLKRHNLKASSDGSFIHQLSGGNPKANYLLAVHKNLATALDQTIEDMLKPVPADQRRLTRDYLEALAIPNLFDETRIPIFLTAYNPEAYQALSLPQVRDIQRTLVGAGFAFWQGEGNEYGYALYDSTRNLIRNYLIAAQKDLWIKLQQSAIDLYQSWADKYPRNRERWLREAVYHQQQLQFDGKLIEM